MDKRSRQAAVQRVAESDTTKHVCMSISDQGWLQGEQSLSDLEERAYNNSSGSMTPNILQNELVLF